VTRQQRGGRLAPDAQRAEAAVQHLGGVMPTRFRYD
jgi:hypothetical protein